MSQLGILLVSSGIDSPVAAHLMLKRGVELKAVHFNNFPQPDHLSVDAVGKLIEKLQNIHKEKIKLYVVHNHANQLLIAQKVDHRLHCIICKRLMYRIAAALGKDADFLVTGENLGQVASQTLENLTILNDAVKTEVLRPLLSFDKQETVDIAKQIGTYELSCTIKEGCAFVPKHPATRAALEKVLAEESRLNIDAMVKRSVEKTSLLCV
ncbi:hypothetical protein KY320_02145 [Candidatus Woesearchaeota archaeon]|nr:hypothetical protein [Candidatus Woesearchaeota archaeon]